MNELQDAINKATSIANKDIARMTAFPVVAIKRTMELVEDPVALQQFAKETAAIARDFADESPRLFQDSFKDEREHMRIYAKRNELDQAFQTLIGVSGGTPDDYDPAYKTKYLS